MGRKQRDPIAETRAEVDEALKAGKTELSIDGSDPEVVRRACEVTSLTNLRLFGEVKALPAEIGKLVNLEHLKLENTKLATFPPEIGRLVKLTHIWSYSCEIETLPDEIEGLQSLEKWVLWSNKLRRLPRSIGALRKLEELELKWNKLEEIPDEIAQLTRLEKLDLASNRLGGLPAELSSMTNLRELKLGDNTLSTFPIGITTLPALERLELQENAITELPSGIGRLRRLRDLFLTDNKISKLPEEIFGLSIENLGLKNNQLREVPVAIGAMKQLASLSLDGNPIENVPAEIVSQGKAAIFEHLGLSKARVIDDVVDPKAVAGKKAAIEQFVRAAKRKVNDEEMRDTLVAFLTGKSNKLPPARRKDHYSFGHICEALAPYPEWTAIDRRIIAFITQEAWDFKQPGHDYDTGYHEELFAWVKQQLANETDDRLFTSVAGELIAHGLEASALARRALSEMADQLKHEDGRLSSFGRWVIDAVEPSVLREAAKERRSVRDGLVPVLLAYAPALFEQLADDLVALDPNDDGKVHLPDEALMALCKTDPARWDGLLQEALVKIGDCMPCRANAVRILGECYPGRREQCRELATRLLADVSERKNKEQRFELHWTPDGWDDATAPFIGWMLDRFGDAVAPAVMKYAEDTKVFQLDVAEVVANKLGQRGIDIVAEGLKMQFDSDDIAPHFRKMFALLEPLDWSKYHDLAWDLAQSELEQVRRAACTALGKLPAKLVLARAKERLTAKRSCERAGGAMILGLLDDPGTKAPLGDILAGEKSDDVRDVVVATVYRTLQKIDRKEADKRVAAAKARGKLASPAAKWLDEKKLPAPSWVGGKAKVGVDTLRFLFHRQTRVGEIAPDPEARDIFPLIQRDDAFGDKLLALIVKNGGASAKTRFALTVLGLLGGDSVIETLEEIAVEGKNVNAVETLALLGTKEAARALDRIARVFRTKYPNVRDAAQDGFATIADAMGLTPFELADTLLPDLGFVDHRKPIKVGKRALELVIGPDLKIGFVDGDTVLKAPPKELDAKQKAMLKELGAELKEAARGLRASLEYYLIVQRRWKLADWKAFFLEHPLAAAFARRLVWGAYDNSGKRTALFRLTDDRKPGFVDASGNKVAPSGAIGLVHPFDLPQAERDRWQAVFPEQPLAQLARPVHAAAADALAKTLAFDFEGKTVNAGTFKARAERLGWRRGSVIDGGAISAYRKAYPSDQIEVFVRVDNLGVGFDSYESEATLQDFFFVKQGTVTTGSYTYDEPRDPGDRRLLRLGDVPPIVLSETFGDLGAIIKQREAEAD